MKTNLDNLKELLNVVEIERGNYGISYHKITNNLPLSPVENYPCSKTLICEQTTLNINTFKKAFSFNRIYLEVINKILNFAYHKKDFDESLSKVKISPYILFKDDLYKNISIARQLVIRDTFSEADSIIIPYKYKMLNIETDLKEIYSSHFDEIIVFKQPPNYLFNLFYQIDAQRSEILYEIDFDKSAYKYFRKIETVDV